MAVVIRPAGSRTSESRMNGCVAAVAALEAVREVRGTDRAALGGHHGLLPPGEQGRARLRRRTQPQDPRDPAPMLWDSGRRLSPPEDPDLHPRPPASLLNCPKIAHTISRRPPFYWAPAQGHDTGAGIVAEVRRGVKPGKRYASRSSGRTPRRKVMRELQAVVDHAASLSFPLTASYPLRPNRPILPTLFPEEPNESYTTCPRPR